jgi:retron-type reverse transcriptase
VISPLLANIALSVLDEHFAREWAASGTSYQRFKARSDGAATYRIVRYADLCRARHKSAYAEHRIMPTRLPDALVSGGLAGFWSA